jgi:hypothetical protein
MKRCMTILAIIIMCSVSITLLASCKGRVKEGNSRGSAIASELIGTWRNYESAGISAQSLGEVEFKNDGTFSYVMAIAISTGSGETSNDYGVAASSEGKYKVTGDNRILLYDIRGGHCEENTYYHDLKEIVEKTYSDRDTSIADIELIYSLDNSGEETVITLEPVGEKEPDRLGFALFKADYPLTQVK